jgi:hypothetical protein
MTKKVHKTKIPKRVAPPKLKSLLPVNFSIKLPLLRSSEYEDCREKFA